ncbi:radical SAM protein [Phytohabitans sp. ZYX-F-186]|uniref:Radical SAM protein n=1 Tax=Phytohabitans maris TaxID=3071409 RepID=A0ABU0ZWA8_9ACTN|nr:radical SAM protein [Phytohabitans sp. ZYX-F-186]MDQ7911325.1 radical SAM protein [Phytohabitans sp. ZYX-F-186]
MIGTRLDEVDAPRLVKSSRGWWFIGNQTWTLLKPEHVAADGTVRADVDEFLRDNGAYRPRTPKSFSLTVLTSTACNLGCGYCFQNVEQDPKGGFRPLRVDRERLSERTIERIMEFTAGRMAEAELDKLHLLLFGGEPLLNPKACLSLLRRSAALGLDHATMITNGVLLTPPLATELAGAGLRGIQITFDGSREDHDRTRVRHNGGATFDTIVRNVGRASEVTDFLWNLRVNVSHHSFPRIGELFDQLDGRLDPSRCTVVFAWVGDSGVGYGNDLGLADEVAEAFVSWSIAAAEAGFRVALPSMKTTCQICSEPGGRYGAVVNADGTLYSCWQSAGKRGWDVGTLESGYRDVAQVRDRWVTCGYEYRHADAEAMSAFQDRVDARVLDYLHATNRL